MYYDIFVNEKLLATVGLDNPQHLTISLSLSDHDELPFIMASAMASPENGEQEYLTWLQENITSKDTVKIIPSEKNSVSEPIQVRKMRLGKSSDEERFCDFCKGSEDVVGKIVQAGDTPFICKNCAELALEIIIGE